MVKKFDLKKIEISEIPTEELKELNTYIRKLEKLEYYDFVFKCCRQYNRLILKIKYNENILKNSDVYEVMNESDYMDSISELYKIFNGIKEFLSEIFKEFDTDRENILNFIFSLPKTEIYKFILNVSDVSLGFHDEFNSESILIDSRIGIYIGNLTLFDEDKRDSIDFVEIQAATKIVTSILEKENAKYLSDCKFKLFVNHKNFNLTKKNKKIEDQIEEFEKNLLEYENFKEENLDYLQKKEVDEEDKDIYNIRKNMLEEKQLIDEIDFLKFQNKFLLSFFPILNE